MLGLVSTLCRRERLRVGQLLDAQIGAALRRFSRAHQREQALAERERGLLASAPVLVGRRFDQLRGTSDGWLATFHDDFRETLAAELELRLQPLDGLIAALDDEATRMQ
jgi:hypothetical protein